MLDLNIAPLVLTKLLASPRELVLIALLVAAAVIDWRSYCIPTALGVMEGVREGRG